MAVKTKGFLAGAAVGAVGAAAAAALAAGNLAQPEQAAVSQPAQFIRTQNVTPALIRPPAGAPLSFADIVERVSPAVVSLEVRGRPQRNALQGFPGLENFPDLFPRAPGQGQGQRRPNPDGEPGDNDNDRVPETQASGSGFFISPDGYIVTNNHVVENAREIKIILSDEREFKARVVGRDEETDLAVLKVEGRNFPYVNFAADAKPRVGDWVIAVGNPFQLGNTATAGIVSAYGREIGDQFVNYLQIDASINRGNSGGPTFDIQGRVIGVNTAIYSTTGGSQGIGFAIPADVAADITRQLISGGRISRGYLGVGIEAIDRERAEALGLPAARGALVGEVRPGGPAEKAGIQTGDVVLSVNGREVNDANSLTRQVAATRAGQTIRLEVLRGGQRRTLSVVSGTRPSAQELAALDNADGANPNTPDAPAQPRGPAILGMNLSPLDEAARRRYSIGAAVRGVVIERVEANSDASEKGLRRGIVITRVNDRPVATVADVQGAIETARRAGRPSVLLWLNVAGNTATRVVQLEERRG
jgi:serine protease Do